MNTMNGDHALTALHVAVEVGHIDVVRLLLENGANVDETDQWGGTALHLAVLRRGRQDQDCVHDIVKLLVTSGADPNKRDKNNMTQQKCKVERIVRRKLRIVTLHLRRVVSP